MADINVADKDLPHLVHKRIIYRSGLEGQLYIDAGGTVPDLSHLTDSGYALMRKQRYYTPVSATDAAVELAKEKGVNLAEVEGTGADGRVTVADVEKADHKENPNG